MISRMLLVIGLLSSTCVAAFPTANPTVRDMIGVNIHFTRPKPGEMEMIAAAGFGWVRMDFPWSSIEKEAGKYNFTAYEGLLNDLDRYRMHAVLILDYSNPLYDHDVAPYSDQGRAAFARWAAASVKHFAGRGVVWEMYNEPNGGFWQPKPDAHAYSKLAIAVGQALRQAAPQETYIGPAAARIPLPYLQACFQDGVLQYFSAVSVHPYRTNEPESALAGYDKVRTMIRRFSPDKPAIPIVSGEWGYSSTGLLSYPNETLQAKYVTRSLLANISDRIPLNIWYDWHDDGVDALANTIKVSSTQPTTALPKNIDPECHFGLVRNAYFAGRDPVYDPKPAYTAAKVLGSTIGDYHFVRRLKVGDGADYCLLFQKGSKLCLACWTTKPMAHTVPIPQARGTFRRIHGSADEPPVKSFADSGLRIILDDEVQYLILKPGATTPTLP